MINPKFRELPEWAYDIDGTLNEGAAEYYAAQYGLDIYTTIAEHRSKEQTSLDFGLDAYDMTGRDWGSRKEYDASQLAVVALPRPEDKKTYTYTPPKKKEEYMKELAGDDEIYIEVGQDCSCEIPK